MIAQKLKPGAGDHERPARYVLSHQTAPDQQAKPPLRRQGVTTNDADHLQLPPRRAGERRQKLAVEIVDQDRGRLGGKGKPGWRQVPSGAAPCCRSIFAGNCPIFQRASNRTSLDRRRAKGVSRRLHGRQGGERCKPSWLKPTPRATPAAGGIVSWRT